MEVKLKQNMGSFYSNDIERFQGLSMVDPGALPASKMEHFATVVNGLAIEYCYTGLHFRWSQEYLTVSFYISLICVPFKTN